MTIFEKIIIPLVDECIMSIDLTDAAGFIDSYTEDPDKPSGEKELFLVYDDSKRNNFTEDRARRFAKSPMVKKTYIKYVNGVPYLVYSFWIKPEVKKLYNGILTLSTEQKSKILQFWTILDSIVDTVMTNPVLSLSVGHSMPLEDYREDMFADSYLEIKKGDSLVMRLPPLFFCRL